MASTKVSYTPEPATIRAMCEQIQAGWTETERRNRQCYDTDPVRVTESTLNTGQFTFNVMEEE